jgi:hypothetical protein
MGWLSIIVVRLFIVQPLPDLVELLKSLIAVFVRPAVLIVVPTPAKTAVEIGCIVIFGQAKSFLGIFDHSLVVYNLNVGVILHPLGILGLGCLAFDIFDVIKGEPDVLSTIIAVYNVIDTATLAFESLDELIEIISDDCVNRDTLACALPCAFDVPCLPALNASHKL